MASDDQFEEQTVEGESPVLRHVQHAAVAVSVCHYSLMELLAYAAEEGHQIPPGGFNPDGKVDMNVAIDADITPEAMLMAAGGLQTVVNKLQETGRHRLATEGPSRARPPR